MLEEDPDHEVWLHCNGCSRARRVNPVALNKLYKGLSMDRLKECAKCRVCGHRGAQVTIHFVGNTGIK